MAMSFPDVCKTPTPAGPVPIPYPNIAQSSDTADGSTTVKVDGNPIMLKSSNFRMSSGDEAGSAMGVASNKIKGKALPINASFDVKVDGKNVFRLTDPMQTNAGSANTVNPAEVQGPLPPGLLLSPECQKLKEKRDQQKEDIQAKNAGMLESHYEIIQDIATRREIAIYFRKTDAVCGEWIYKKHQPKPHAVFFGNTIKDSIDEKTGQEVRVAGVQRWLKLQFELQQELAKVPGSRVNRTDKNFGDPGGSPILISHATTRGDLLGSNAKYSANGMDFKGVVGANQPNGLVEPLKRRLGVANVNGDYEGKWITADYDIFMIIKSAEGCEQIPQGGDTFMQIKDEINSSLQWDAIQHGPQTQWISNAEETAAMGQAVDFPKEFDAALKQKSADKKIQFLDAQGQPKRKPMNVIDKEVTVISPAGGVYLEKPEDTLNALLCRKCDK